MFQGGAPSPPVANAGAATPRRAAVMTWVMTRIGGALEGNRGDHTQCKRGPRRGSPQSGIDVWGRESLHPGTGFCDDWRAMGDKTSNSAPISAGFVKLTLNLRGVNKCSKRSERTQKCGLACCLQQQKPGLRQSG